MGLVIHNSLSDGGSSVRTFWDPRSFDREREGSWSDQQHSLLHSNVDCGKAKWVKFCFAWLSFTVPVIVLKSEEIPTTSPGKVSSSLLWKRLLLWWSSQLSSLFLALCIHVCLNFPCNNSFVIKWLEQMVSEHLGIGRNVIIHLLIDNEVGIDLYRILSALEKRNEILLVF